MVHGTPLTIARPKRDWTHPPRRRPPAKGVANGKDGQGLRITTMNPLILVVEDGGPPSRRCGLQISKG